MQKFNILNVNNFYFHDPDVEVFEGEWLILNTSLDLYLI